MNPPEAILLRVTACPAYSNPVRTLFQLRANPFRRRNECFVGRSKNLKKVLHFDGIVIYSHG